MRLTPPPAPKECAFQNLSSCNRQLKSLRASSSCWISLGGWPIAKRLLCVNHRVIGLTPYLDGWQRRRRNHGVIMTLEKGKFAYGISTTYNSCSFRPVVNVPLAKVKQRRQKESSVPPGYFIFILFYIFPRPFLHARALMMLYA